MRGPYIVKFVVYVFTPFLFLSSPISAKNLRKVLHIICKSMILHIRCSLICADATVSKINEV
jgi:hypothetical protein